MYELARFRNLLIFFMIISSMIALRPAACLSVWEADPEEENQSISKNQAADNHRIRRHSKTGQESRESSGRLIYNSSSEIGPPSLDFSKSLAHVRLDEIFTIKNSSNGISQLVVFNNSIGPVRQIRLLLTNYTPSTKNNTKQGREDVFKVQRNHSGQLSVVLNNTEILENLEKKHYQGELLNRTTSPPYKRVVFPGETNHHNPASLVSRITAPSGCSDSGKLFCSEVESYPALQVANILQRESHKFNELFGEDIVPINLTQRFDAPGEEGLCRSKETLIYPQVGYTKENTWNYIINQPNYTQGILVEECDGVDLPCAWANIFPNGYKTECRQKYIYRQLLSYDGNDIAKKAFKFPACCKCIIKMP